MERKMRAPMLIFSILIAAGCLANAQKAAPPAIPQEDQITAEQMASLDVRGKYSLYGYVAVAKDDPAACPHDSCQTLARDLVDERRLAEGRCSEITGTMFKDICWAVQQNECGTMKSLVEQKYCLAVLSGDPNDMPSVYEVMRASVESPETRDYVWVHFAVINGFRKEGLPDCQSYLDARPNDIDPAYRYFGCRIVFSQKPERTMLEAEKMLSLYELGKTEPKYCKQIKDPDLMAACLKASGAAH